MWVAVENGREMGNGGNGGKWGMQFASNAFNKLKALKPRDSASNESTKVHRIAPKGND